MYNPAMMGPGAQYERNVSSLMTYNTASKYPNCVQPSDSQKRIITYNEQVCLHPFLPVLVRTRWHFRQHSDLTPHLLACYPE